MFLTVYTIFLLLYISFNIVLERGWDGIPEDQDFSPDRESQVSVIIVVRNEEKNIGSLLADLDSQTYPKHKLEVLIFNDHSTDRTCDVVEAYANKSPLNITLIHLELGSSSPKKGAISRGVKMAKGSWIMITDGDCRVPEGWISSFVSKRSLAHSDFIFGPVSFFQTRSILNEIATIEFASLVGAGAATFHYKKPIMCNAANLGFSKDAFQEVNGFEGNENTASGDDVFLMRKVFKRDPPKVSFLKDPESIVLTYPERSLQSFLYQRIRWAGKWKQVDGFENILVPTFIFLFHLLTLALALVTVMGKVSIWYFVIVTLLKLLFEYIFISKVMLFLNNKAGWISYLIASLIYPFYAVFLGLAANFATYKWKGRRYSN